MNKTLSIVIGVIAVASLAVGITAYNKTPDTLAGSVGPQGPKGERGLQGPAGKDAPVRLGSLSSPDIISNYLSVNGITRYYTKQTMKTATTSLCAMLSPSATSSLRFASFRITTGTSTAATIDIGTSTTAFATTTNLSAANSVASGAQGAAIWSPTGGSVDDAKLAPSTYVNVMTAGAGLGGYTYTGYCQAEFLIY